jgi:NAD(P)-dependent dehydrogenase (short-subunit alcohol dehydrogenase family)
MTEEEWDGIIAYHLKGHFTTIKHACIVFRQQRSGRIVNTSSESGLGNMGQANYSAAKEGIVGLTRTVARDMGRYGVTCNAIRPRAATRLTMTEELRQALERSRAAGIMPAGGETPIGQNPPDAVAPMVVWLCTDAAANVNGRNFIVGGGMVSLCSEITQERSIYKTENSGIWKLDELDRIVPATLAQGLVNQWAPQPATEKR